MKTDWDLPESPASGARFVGQLLKYVLRAIGCPHCKKAMIGVH